MGGGSSRNYEAEAEGRAMREAALALELKAQETRGGADEPASEPDAARHGPTQAQRRARGKGQTQAKTRQAIKASAAEHRAAVLVQALVRGAQTREAFFRFKVRRAARAGVRVAMPGTIQGHTGWYFNPFDETVTYFVVNGESGGWQQLLGPVAEDDWRLTLQRARTRRDFVACPGTAEGESGLYMAPDSKVRRRVVDDRGEWRDATSEASSDGAGGDDDFDAEDALQALKDAHYEAKTAEKRLTRAVPSLAPLMAPLAGDARTRAAAPFLRLLANFGESAQAQLADALDELEQWSANLPRGFAPDEEGLPAWVRDSAADVQQQKAQAAVLFAQVTSLLASLCAEEPPPPAAAAASSGGAAKAAAGVYGDVAELEAALARAREAEERAEELRGERDALQTELTRVKAEHDEDMFNLQSSLMKESERKVAAMDADHEASLASLQAANAEVVESIVAMQEDAEEELVSSFPFAEGGQEGAQDDEDHDEDHEEAHDSFAAGGDLMSFMRSAAPGVASELPVSGVQYPAGFGLRPGTATRPGTAQRMQTEIVKKQAEQHQRVVNDMQRRLAAAEEARLAASEAAQSARAEALELRTELAAAQPGGGGGGGAQDEELRQQVFDLEEALEAAKEALVEERVAHKTQRDMAAALRSKASGAESLSSEVDSLRQALVSNESAAREYESQLAALNKELVVAQADAGALGELREAHAKLLQAYKEEQLLRKRYHNMIEDMKGKVRVMARCRPLSESERARGDAASVECVDGCSLRVRLPRGERAFQFDSVFPPDSTQAEVFEDSRALVQSAIDGYNCVMFAYGQTGSGKTFTMAGSPDQPGITPRAMGELFAHVERQRGRFSFSISCYMLELYRDSLVDLLLDPEQRRPKPPRLAIKKDPKGIVYVQNATVKPVESLEEMQRWLDYGTTQRHTSSTAMNAESSRSHLVFSIIIEATNTQTHRTTCGKLTLVDLAGCERVSKTGAAGNVLKEAQSINKSLTALGDVISALSSGAKHVPYRNHALTMLMSDSLGGNAKTLMFVMVSPADFNADETVNALTYASRVKMIKNNSEQTVETQEIRQLKGMIRDLQAGVVPEALAIAGGGEGGGQDGGGGADEAAGASQ